MNKNKQSRASEVCGTLSSIMHDGSPRKESREKSSERVFEEVWLKPSQICWKTFTHLRSLINSKVDKPKEIHN